jgi:hypothetical protein
MKNVGTVRFLHQHGRDIVSTIYILIIMIIISKENYVNADSIAVALHL